MFQNNRLLPWRTNLQNVLLSAEIRNLEIGRCTQEARELLSEFGLSSYEHSYPRDLSEGMRQRVAFARALLIKPQVLLLDEPFSNIDYEVRLQLENKVLRLAAEKEITTVVVTHDLEEAIVLGQHIFVSTQRPMRIAKAFHIDIPLSERTALGMRRQKVFGETLGALAAELTSVPQ